MSVRRRVKHTTSLEDRIAQRLAEINARAESLPPGSKKRERLERTVRQANRFAYMIEWIATAEGLGPRR